MRLRHNDQRSFQSCLIVFSKTAPQGGVVFPLFFKQKKKTSSVVTKQ